MTRAGGSRAAGRVDRTTALGGEVDPDAVSHAVLSCPSVDRMSGGSSGGLGTYLPGRRILGVRIRDTPGGGDVEVHVVARCGPPMAEIAAEVTAAVLSVAPGRRVVVGIDDIETDDFDPRAFGLGTAAGPTVGAATGSTARTGSAGDRPAGRPRPARSPSGRPGG